MTQKSLSANKAFRVIFWIPARLSGFKAKAYNAGFAICSFHLTLSVYEYNPIESQRVQPFVAIERGERRKAKWKKNSRVVIKANKIIWDVDPRSPLFNGYRQKQQPRRCVDGRLLIVWCCQSVCTRCESWRVIKMSNTLCGPKVCLMTSGPNDF